MMSPHSFASPETVAPSSHQSESRFCFCTSAFGFVYRALARELAQDLAKYAPTIPFILFTDQPSDFKNFQNTLAFKHQRQGVYTYHERRFAIAKALSMHESCIYLDADVRICAPVPLEWNWQPGITAKSCYSMMKHIRQQLHKTERPRPQIVRKFEFAKQMAKKVGLDIEADEITFINEFLFVVTRDGGKEQEFLDLWGKLALYAELNQHHKHPAYAMGLAAKKVGFSIRRDELEGLVFFDDRVEQYRIDRGEADPNARKAYFETQKRIEASGRTLPRKVLQKLTHPFKYNYRLNRLRLSTFLSDRDFYYDGIESDS